MLLFERMLKWDSSSLGYGFWNKAGPYSASQHWQVTAAPLVTVTLTHHRVQRLREHLLSGLTVLGDSRFTPSTPRHGPEAGAAITTHMLLMWPWTLKTGKWCARGHSEGPGRANVEAGRSGFRPPFPAPWSRGQTLGLQTQSRAWPAGPPHLGDIVALEF